MKKILAITKKDFMAYFASPVAYIVLAVYLLITGYFFWEIIRAYAMAEYRNMPYNIEIRALVSNMAVILLFISPMITMRLFAEEKKLGTMELLHTSPVSNLQLVLGKYFSSCILFLILTFITLQYPLIFIIWGNPSIGPMFSAYLGFLLLGLSFFAIGLFASTLSENQIVVTVVTFGVLLMLWIIGWAADYSTGIIERIISSLSILNHLNNFIKGVIDMADVIYYLSLIFIFLFLTIRRLELKR